MPLTAGSKLGPYEIAAPLGVGGMGEVYRARDSRLHREVAIKILPETIAAGARERFEREARAASALSHPRICAIYDVGEADGRLFLVMELVEGMTLREYAAAKPLTPAEVIRIGLQIADALEAAHARGVVHRDVKPGNIMITPGGDVKVLDFGLAKHIVADEIADTRTLELLTLTGTIIGTPHYMSPEALQGRADARSDIWALGVVLYELLAGRLPFAGTTALEVSSAILRETAPALPAGVPAGLRAIVERCLAKRPDERYQRASDVRAALHRSHTTGAPRATARRWKLWTAGAAAMLAAAGVIAGLMFFRPRADTTGRRTSTGAPASANQEANDAFELAMQLLRVQNHIPRGGKMLERALALDPHFPEARRYHAFNYIILILNGYSNDTSLLYKAEAELQQAMREDPSLQSLPSALTAVYLTQGRRELAPLDALDRVVRQNPSHRDSILWRALGLWLVEDNRQATELLKGVLEREPLFGAARMFLGEIFRTEGDTAGAIREEQKVLDQAPGNISAIRLLVLAYMDAGALDKAESVMEAARPQFAENYQWQSTRALLFAREDKRNEALDAMGEETLKFAAASWPATLDAAEFYALLGDHAKAIEWLDRAVRNGDERIDWFRKDPRLTAIRQDPRFQTIIESVKARRKHEPNPSNR